MLRGREALWAAMALSILPGCHRGDSSRSASSSAPLTALDEPGSSRTRGACSQAVVAEVPWPVTTLFATPGQIYGASRVQGTVFAVSTAGDPGARAVKTVSSSEREPFALGVRGGKPVWASSEGVFGSNDDGTNRQTLKIASDVQTLAMAPDGVYFTTQSGHLWRVDWPRAIVAEDVNKTEDVELGAARELVANGAWLAYLDRNGVRAYEVATGHQREIGGCPDGPCQRKPHDLSISGDGKSVVWHEGEADLLPGRDSRAFSAMIGAWTLTELTGHYESSSRYLFRDPCVYGPASYKRNEEKEWRRLDTGSGEAPITDDASYWYWTERVPDDAGFTDLESGRSRIIAALKVECCY